MSVNPPEVMPSGVRRRNKKGFRFFCFPCWECLLAGFPRPNPKESFPARSIGQAAVEKWGVQVFFGTLFGYPVGLYFQFAQEFRLDEEERHQGIEAFQATALNHIALSVTDVGRSRDFYVKHLGLRVTRDGSSNCFLNVGPNFLALFRARQAGLAHYCYTIKGYTADSAAETLQAAGFKPRRAENRVYFDDPDGLEVQLSAPNG